MSSLREVPKEKEVTGDQWVESNTTQEFGFRIKLGVAGESIISHLIHL